MLNLVGYNWEPGGTRFNPIEYNPVTQPNLFGNTSFFSGTPPFWRTSGAFMSSVANVPQGVNIVSCVIRADVCSFTANGVPGTRARCDVRSEANDTGSPLVSAADADARPRGLEVVADYTHDVGEFDQVELTLDVTALAQEMVDRAGWTTASRFMFFFDEQGSTGTDTAGEIMRFVGGGSPIAVPQLELIWN